MEMGRHYPLGYHYYRQRLHDGFASKAHLRDEGEIEKAIRRAEFVKKGRFYKNLILPENEKAKVPRMLRN